MMPTEKNCYVYCLLLLLIGCVSFLGCSEERGSPGEAISPVISKVESDIVTAKIGEIFTDPDRYLGRLVRIEGKIVWECPDGCELHLQDSTGKIFVALYPSGIAIPQKLGATAVVEGKVTKGRGRFIIIGKKIEIK